MEEIKTVLKNLIDAAPSKNKIFKRNILKEYLQILVLDYIYSNKDYSRLIFYGGSCLAHCHNLPRLSAFQTQSFDIGQSVWFADFDGHKDSRRAFSQMGEIR